MYYYTLCVPICQEKERVNVAQNIGTNIAAESTDFCIVCINVQIYVDGVFPVWYSPDKQQCKGA